MIEESIRDWINRTLPLSTGDDLAGFVIDTEHFIQDQPAFGAVALHLSHDPISLVNAAVTISPALATLKEIAHALHAAWLNLSYRDFEAISLRPFREATVLRFVTGVPGGALGVTGTFLATGPHYPHLVERFKQDFGTPLSPLPGGLPDWAVRAFGAAM